MMDKKSLIAVISLSVFVVLIVVFSALRNTATGDTNVADANQQPVYVVGEKGPAGGLICYDKGSYTDGWRYLEVNLADFPKATWNNGTFFYTGNMETLGSGLANTTYLVANQGQGSYAALICDRFKLGKYDDWFLPSVEEFETFYENIVLTGLSTLKFDEYYWTSSDAKNSRGSEAIARYSDDLLGYRNIAKQSLLPFRAMRRF